MELLKLSNYQIKYAIATILCSLRTSECYSFFNMGLSM